MEKVHIVARFKIHDGKLEEFNRGKEECISLVKKNEPGALVYDWFLDEGNSLCTVIETYQDSGAVMAHVGNVNASLSKLIEIADFSGEVFGNVSAELKVAFGDMGIFPVPHIGGI